LNAAPAEKVADDVTTHAAAHAYEVAVRALCELTAKQGDLDLRFTPSPSALEGMAGHAVIASRRGKRYETEITLSGEYRQLRVRGRADGYDAANQLEEFKTYRGDLERMPENHRHLHWAQVKIYGWLLCRARKLSDIRLALVYFEIASQRETVLVEQQSAESLRVYFERQCDLFLQWAARELVHREARDASLASLTFPHASFHEGQRQLAESVYRSVKAGRCLLAQAPTGIGKTIGTIFPVLKAMPTEQIDKLFFLVAKTPPQACPDSLARLREREPSMRLRVLELVAREKACEYPERLLRRILPAGQRLLRPASASTRGSRGLQQPRPESHSCPRTRAPGLPLLPEPGARPLVRRGGG
jgi:hypothetical protein